MMKLLIATVLMAVSLKSVHGYYACGRRIGTMECEPVMQKELFKSNCYEKVDPRLCITLRNSVKQQVCNYFGRNTGCQKRCAFGPQCIEFEVNEREALLVRTRDFCAYQRIKFQLERRTNTTGTTKPLRRVNMGICADLEYHVPALHPCQMRGNRLRVSNADWKTPICGRDSRTKQQMRFNSQGEMRLYNCINQTRFQKIRDDKCPASGQSH